MSREFVKGKSRGYRTYLFAVFLAVIMTLSCVAIFASDSKDVVADGNVARIGSTEYATFADAIAAANASGAATTIDILADCSYAPGQEADFATVSLTVNGNDKVITMGSSLVDIAHETTFNNVKFVANNLNNNMFEIMNNVDVTFSVCEFSGTCSVVDWMNFIEANQDYTANLTIDGCIFDMTGANVNRAVRSIINNGTVTVTNCVFIGVDGADRDTPVKVSGTGYATGFIQSGNTQKETAVSNPATLSVFDSGTYKVLLIYVASIGSNYYTTLGDAIAAADGSQPIELLNDCTYAPVEGANFAGVALTVNGNNKTITMGSSLINIAYTTTFNNVKFVANDLNNNMFNITNDVNITFVGCEFSGTCTVTDWLNFIQIGDTYSSTLTVTNCIFDMTGANVNRAIRVVVNNGTVAVNGTTFIGMGAADKDTPVKVTGTGFADAITGTGNVQKATAGSSPAAMGKFVDADKAVLAIIPTYTVTYEVDGGSAAAPTQDPVASGGTFTVASYTGTKAGYTFGGWNDGTSTYAAGASYTMGTSDVTLTAVWTEIPKYTVTIVSNNDGYGTVSQGSIANVPEGSIIAVNGNAITIIGANVLATPTEATAQYTYAFASWSVVDGQQVTSAMTITATFTQTVNKYTVTIIGEGVTVKAGTTVINNGDKVDYNTDLTATIAAKAGYTAAVTPEAVTVTANVTFTGVYTPIAYVIAFDANGGTGTAMANIDATYDVEVALTANTFTKEGYAFGGWATTATGAAVYSDAAKVKNLTTEADATVPLYAVWIQIEKTDNAAVVTVTTDAVSDQAADQLVEAAKQMKDAGTENVSVDVKATETESVSIKSDSIKEAVDSGIGVNIATSKGAMEFSSEALAGLLEDGKTLKSEIKEIEVPPAYAEKIPADAKVFSISLTSNDTAITSFNGVFTVKVAYTATGNTDNLYVGYLAADGTIQKMESHYEDGFMVFTTDHLSDYAVLEDSSSSGNNQGLLLAVLLIAAIVLPIIAGLIIFRKN